MRLAQCEEPQLASQRIEIEGEDSSLPDTGRSESPFTPELLLLWRSLNRADYASISSITQVSAQTRKYQLFLSRYCETEAVLE